MGYALRWRSCGVGEAGFLPDYLGGRGFRELGSSYSAKGWRGGGANSSLDGLIIVAISSSRDNSIPY